MAEELTPSRPWYRPRFRDHGLLDKLEALPAWQAALLVGAGVLGVDWALAPRGQSLVAKAMGKVGLGHGLPLLPPPPRIPAPIPMAPAAAGEFYSFPPPPGVIPSADEMAAGYFAGANLGAGFGHGYMPYGGWAHADPGGPTQYAHAAQRHGGGGFEWE